MFELLAIPFTDPVKPTPTPFINPTNFPPAGIASISSLLNVVLPLVTLFAILVFFIMIIRGAFIWLTSGGSPENLAKAQKTIIWAIVGVVVVIAAFVLVRLIGVILNVNTLL